MNSKPAPATKLARTATLALLTTLCLGTHAMAQTAPTLDQVYQAAQAGRVEQAQQMMQSVLRDHPESGKAHYVEAELLARQGRTSQAREELSTAERLSPGLPFARPEAVQALRRELSASAGLTRSNLSQATAHESPAAPSSGGMSWGVLAALGGGALLAWFVMRLSRPASDSASPAAATGAPYGGPSYLGPSRAGAWPGAGISPNYASNAGVPTMASTSAPGMGSQLAGGLATGLAVGAGVMAAEAMGRSLFGGDRHPAGGFGWQPAAQGQPRQDPLLDPVNPNPDMGGNDFGIQDASSWDNGGATDFSGDGWDN